jgi:hypothetical protein
MTDQKFQHHWLVLLCALMVASCGGGGSSPNNVTQPTLVSIALSPPTVSLAPGATQQLTVTGTYSSGSPQTLAASGETFTSSNTAVATVSATGLVTVVAGAATGQTATISAKDTASSLTTSAATSTVVTVTAVPLAGQIAAATATAQNNALCAAAISPFYWEVGDKTGALAGGSVGVDATGKAVTSSTAFNIASASKWVYGMYVVQLRGGATGLTKGTVSASNPAGTVGDVDFLHFASGYTNMGSDTTSAECPTTDVPDTVNVCLALPDTQPNGDAPNQPYGTQIAANIGIFDYDSGHEEVHASQLGALGDVANADLGATVWATLGVGQPMTYSEPLIAGGLVGSADEYTNLLRAVLNGTLGMIDALGIDPICTNNGATYGASSTTPGVCTAGSSNPIPENWHYSIAHWVEDDPAYNNDGAFSSPGAFGFYPWIDATKTYYGVISRLALPGVLTGVQQGYVSQQCGQLIRHAFITGIEQTGALPAD